MCRGIIGLGYDSENDLWVTVTGDGRLLISATGAELWDQRDTGLGTISGLVVVNGLWVITTDPGGDEYVMWSRDTAGTWNYWAPDPALQYEAMAYSAERGQWLLTVGTGTGYISMSVGVGSVVAT